LCGVAWNDSHDKWARLAVESALPKAAKDILREFVYCLRANELRDRSVQVMIRELAAVSAALRALLILDDLRRTRNFTGALELYCFAGLADGMERAVQL